MMQGSAPFLLSETILVPLICDKFERIVILHFSRIADRDFTALRFTGSQIINVIREASGVRFTVFYVVEVHDNMFHADGAVIFYFASILSAVSFVPCSVRYHQVGLFCYGRIAVYEDTTDWKIVGKRTTFWLNINGCKPSSVSDCVACGDGRKRFTTGADGFSISIFVRDGNSTPSEIIYRIWVRNGETGKILIVFVLLVGVGRIIDYFRNYGRERRTAIIRIVRLGVAVVIIIVAVVTARRCGR